MSRATLWKGSSSRLGSFFIRAICLSLLCVHISGCSIFSSSRKVKYINYPVQRGDTLYSIGQRFKTSVDEIATINGIRDSKSLEIGQIIKVPYRGQSLSRRPTDQIGERPENIKPDEDSVNKVRLTSAKRYIGNLQWPIPNAAVTSRFGNRWLSFHEGIDLHADEGTPVLAAHSGLVVYAGDGIRGYGNIVVIQSEGLVTVYAHNRTIKVDRGEYVKRGQRISYSGSTGVSTGPHLHFETRIRDSKGLNVAIDPMTFYSKRR